MQLLRIDERNYRDYELELALVHGVMASELCVPAASVSADPGATVEQVWNRCGEYFGPPAAEAAVWLFTGGLARSLLRDLPVHGCTFLDGRRVTVAVTWEDNPEMLGRVFGHEWCHAFRLLAGGISSQGAYVRYLSEPSHWLYEETLAIATEKWLCPHLSWEDAAGVAYSPSLSRWVQAEALGDVDVAEFAALEWLADSLREREAERAAFVYYLAYRICRTRPVVEHLAELVQMPAQEGLWCLCRECV